MKPVTRTVALSILLAGGIALASAARAQEAPVDAPVAPPAAGDPTLGGGYSPPTDAQPSIWSDGIPYSRYSMQDGIDALQARNFVEAEAIFAEALRYNRNDAETNFYLGVARMDLGKWGDAKKHLEIALRKKPKHPDPKSRLGVTYAKLGDTAAANALRADLVKMGDACKSSCRLSPYITAGIQMIDEALAETPATPAGRG